MGMGLVFSALSGAGQGVADAAQGYEHYNFQQMLQQQEAELAVHKQDLINQNKIAATNTDEAATGKIAADAFSAATGRDPASFFAPAATTTPGTPPATPTTAPATPPVDSAATPAADAGAPAVGADGATAPPVSGAAPTSLPGSTPSIAATPAASPGATPPSGLVATVTGAAANPPTLSANPAGAMTAADAALYRKGLLASAVALRNQGKTAEANAAMDALDKTYHTLGYAGSNDLLTGETITGEAAMLKAKAAFDAAHGSRIDPEKQLEIQGKTLEHDNKILDSALGDDSLIKSLMTNPMYAVNPEYKANADAQINDLRNTRAAVLQIAQESGHAVPVTTALSLVQGLKTGATKVLGTGDNLYFNLGNGRIAPVPQALVAGIKRAQVTPGASPASTTPGATVTPAGLPIALNIKQVSKASYRDGYEPDQYQWLDPRTGTYKVGTKNADGTYAYAGGLDGKTETFAVGQ